MGCLKAAFAIKSSLIYGDLREKTMVIIGILLKSLDFPQYLTLPSFPTLL